MRVLITAGGTRAYIDEIRWLGNVSSGRFGAELALHALDRGAEVLHFHSERAVSPVEHRVDIRDDLESQFAAIRTARRRWSPMKILMLAKCSRAWTAALCLNTL